MPVSLRVSSFCRPLKPQKHPIQVRVLENPPASSFDPNAVYVTSALLVALSLRHKSLACLVHKNRRAPVRLHILGGESLVVRISPTMATALFDYYGSCDEQLSCWLEPHAAQDAEPLNHVRLRSLGRPILSRFVRRFYNRTDHCPLPLTGQLLTNGSLISVSDQEEVYFYQVLGLDSMIYTTTCHTQFEVVVDDRLPLPRLPPLTITKGYHQAQTLKMPPHPSIPALVQALLHTPTLAPETILHVLGNEKDHHVRTCVRSSADRLGLRCLEVLGLAAAAPTPTTGSLLDKLQGLQATLDQAMESHAPCLVHLCHFDRELTNSDAPLRHEQESRIWSLLVDRLRVTQGIPPVSVVISTSRPLMAGPLLQNLVFPSISMELPDVEYARYLWKTNDDSVDLLVKRPAQDIVLLRRQWEESQTKDLQSLCERLDKNVRISSVYWDDVGGLAHVRQEIMDAIELPLLHPHLFPHGGGRSGILLYGPPGTGKTLVAKAVATECGLPFLSVKGPSLLGSYVGESEANVRNIFKSAHEAAEEDKKGSCVLFFDELDSLAPRREGGSVMDRVVATLFAELDGYHYHSKTVVFVMGATNRPDLLDPGLLRPGRLDRLVYLGIAKDRTERAKILAAQIHKLKLDQSPLQVAFQVVDHLPERLTGADVSTIASGAVLKAIHRLCGRAENALQQRREEQKEDVVNMDGLLSTWTEAELTPVVTVDDLLEVAKEVTPSVSEAELQRYERLRDQFSR